MGGDETADVPTASLAYSDVFYAGMSFEGFVGTVSKIPDENANGHFRSQYTFVTDEGGQLVVDYVPDGEARSRA